MLTNSIHIAAMFQQKVKESIQTWLVRLWVMGGDGISLIRKDTEKNEKHHHIPYLPEVPHGNKG